LRRAAIAVNRLVLECGLRMKLRSVVFWESVRQFQRQALAYRPKLMEEVRALSPNMPETRQWELFFELDNYATVAPSLMSPKVVAKDVLDFFADRLKVQQREAGVRHDLIDAVFALGGEDDLVRLLARVNALQAFMATEDGTNLLAGYKRAANILKQAGEVSGTAAATPPTDADAALLAALDAAEPAASAAVAEERFTDAMAALASLRAPIDAFFDGVMVNDPDEAVRAYRLGLLSRFTGAVHGVADFSKIEG
ncbi:MAG TPA: glycine--tRNA ligase subunit beta, partial [Sphingopyxis sp.]|nr:glycine--tRNA ligase subunit beta [Sphingopyxis sp.]